MATAGLSLSTCSAWLQSESQWKEIGSGNKIKFGQSCNGSAASTPKLHSSRKVTQTDRKHVAFCRPSFDPYQSYLHRWPIAQTTAEGFGVMATPDWEDKRSPPKVNIFVDASSERSRIDKPRIDDEKKKENEVREEHDKQKRATHSTETFFWYY